MRGPISMILHLVTVLLASASISACAQVNIYIHADTPPISILGQPYELQMSTSQSCAGYDSCSYSDDVDFRLDEGVLPEGIDILSSGLMTGVPTEVGLFNFNVEAFAQEWYISGAGHHWMTLFVTELSSNVDCPSPDDTDESSLHLCLGNADSTGVVVGDEILLDVTYFISFDEAQDLDIRSISFTIGFDSNYFSAGEIASDAVLREAASFSNPQISVDTSIAGQVTITLTAVDEKFNMSGRLMDLPITLLQMTDAQSFDLTLMHVSIKSGDGSERTVTSVDGQIF